jgi:hypothetical protein
MTRRRTGLLTTESSKDFARQHQGLVDQIRPAGAVETEYVRDTVYAAWEIERYRRIGAAILSSRMVEAIENLLKELLPQQDVEAHMDLKHAAEDYARRYFSDSEARAVVSNLLRNFQLDEAAIEAEAFRLCAAELEVLDRMIALRTGRRARNFFVMGELRQSGFLQPPSDPALEDDVPQLVAVAKRGADVGE